MRRFQFRMEKLLRLKEHLEQIQKVETIQQENVVREVMQFRDNLFQETMQTREKLTIPQGQDWKAREQHQQYRYFIRLGQESIEAQKKLIQETEILQQKRKVLIEKSRERKTLDRLKERKKQQWTDASMKEDQATLDEVGIIAEIRNRERGGVLLTLVLLILCISAGVFCFMVWKDFRATGGTRFEWARRPFDYFAQKRQKEKLEAYQHQQRVNREKKMALAQREGGGVAPMRVTEKEGFSTAAQRIRQKEESLRLKESELDAREVALEQAQRDLKSELTRLTNIQKRITEELANLKDIEKRRKSEMSAEREAKLMDLSNSVKSMSAKRAAALLLEIAFPTPGNTNAPPFPVGENFEGPELVRDLFARMQPRNKAEILDAMTKVSPEKTAVLMDMLDNIRTGLETTDSQQ